MVIAVYKSLQNLFVITARFHLFQVILDELYQYYFF